MSNEEQRAAGGDQPIDRRWTCAFWIAWGLVTLLAVLCELLRLREAGSGPDAARIWWSDPQVDWTPFVPILLLAVPAWFLRNAVRRVPPSNVTANAACRRGSSRRAWLLSIAVGCAGLLMSWYVGQQFGDLPPAYHDEFSYLFQAQTFLAGRVSYPSFHRLPSLFDQMHVLNEGRFASRYFPGVGLWMAPFVAWGHPWLGHWIANALTSFLVFWIGRELADNSVGFLAGLLTALSPGIALFSNLLLAHHPTLVGLLLFVLSFLRMRRAASRIWALLAGVGLTYAMLCRPMTAAGVGLPFGLWMAWWIVRGSAGSEESDVEGAEASGRSLRGRLAVGAMLGVPLIAGFIGLVAYNRAITGDGFTTPYSLYTRTYTPRHAYGFNNRVRGEQQLGPKVLANYDEWAENLTPQLAAKNVLQRLKNSLRWTLGIVPLSLTAIVFVLTIKRWSLDWWLIAAAIASLHLVHIPYWFEGIMGWHYVFESAPLWLLLWAGVSLRLWRGWRATGRRGMQVWGIALLGLSLLVNLVTIVPFWPARLDVGMAEVGFSRQKYGEVFRSIATHTGGRRALVLVKPDPADRHIDYVVNDPTLDETILYGRFPESATDLAMIDPLFPDRDLWVFEAATGELRLLRRTVGSSP